jgi:YggT family protein
MFLITAVNMFFQALVYLIVGRAIMSWFIRPGDRIYHIYLKLSQITDPLLEPFRRLTYRFGIGRTIDFSPVIAIFAIWVLNWIVTKFLIMLLY